MPRRIGVIQEVKETDEVQLLHETSGFVAGTITKLDNEIEFNFPQTATMTKEQAAFVAAHIITLITT